MKTYAVKIELEVDDLDDFEFDKTVELIKNDIECELNCCWHNMDIISMEVYK